MRARGHCSKLLWKTIKEEATTSSKQWLNPKSVPILYPFTFQATLQIKPSLQLRRGILMKGGVYQKLEPSHVLYANQEVAIAMATDRWPALHPAIKSTGLFWLIYNQQTCLNLKKLGLVSQSDHWSQVIFCFNTTHFLILLGTNTRKEERWNYTGILLWHFLLWQW